MAAILACGAACVTSCNNNGNANAEKAATTDSVDAVEMMNHFPFLPALNQYLVDSIGSQYAPGEVCIPCPTIVACDNADSDSAMLVYGDFWVYNFNIAGDTLKTVSGGDHPGVMRVMQNEKGEFVVLSFEQVEDGHLHRFAYVTKDDVLGIWVTDSNTGEPVNLIDGKDHTNLFIADHRE